MKAYRKGDSMKIEQIAPDKVKVTLSEDDLVNMEIDPTCFLSDTNALNGFIIELMHEIYEKTDFNPYHGNITMEAQPENKGLTILLSKGNFKPPMFTQGRAEVRGIIGIPKSEIPGFRDKPKRKKKVIKSVSVRKPTDAPKAMQTFIFDDFEDVCQALIRMSDDVIKSTELYRMDSGYAVLIPTTVHCLDDIAMVMEFALEVKRGIVFEHIREHGEMIASGDELMAMIDGIKNLQN